MNISKTETEAIKKNVIEKSFTALINCYCREFDNWTKYQGIPKYDKSLNQYLSKTNHTLHIRIDFIDFNGYEVFIPVKYFSLTSRHLFYFPVFKRCVKTDSISDMSIHDFLDLISLYAKTKYENINFSIAKERLDDSIANMEKYLILNKDFSFNKEVMNFIDSEQSLMYGHILHPMPKSKKGFLETENLRYSPETKGKFQLHYFLIKKDLIIEKNAGSNNKITDEITEYLLNSINIDENKKIKNLLKKHPGYCLIPMHPWEANYILKQPNIVDLINNNNLISVGEIGDEFTPTSSVRTVYNEHCKWMFKFSLHVKITNSERINLYPELHRGYDMARLLKTDWGNGLKKDFPEIEFLADEAFIAVKDNNDSIINSFNISIRRNPFKSDNNKNISLLAGLFQDNILENSSRITSIITKISEIEGDSKEVIAIRWFEKYLEICIKPLIGIYNKYGLACEFHQQNVMIELDENLYPLKLYYRDNQGFFFRKGKEKILLECVPDLSKVSQSIAPEEMVPPKLNYYIVINNLMGIVNSFGCNQLVSEKKLIDLVYNAFAELRETDETGLVNYILTAKTWYTKANLITSLQNINEADESMEYPCVFLEKTNQLLYHFYCKNLIQPDTRDIVYKRTFEDKEIVIGIRPFDINKDLEMVHEWFHREHTKLFWKMDKPLKDLELWYRTILPSDFMHSFIGEINGKPNFTFEPYWSIKDYIGEYYNVLPTDYGAHFCISTDKREDKYTLESLKTALDYIFMQKEVERCIGEPDVKVIALHKIIKRLGFKFIKEIDTPNKIVSLNFCTRENYLKNNK